MTAAPYHLAGERLMLDPAGALFWPASGLLVVADLHLEKGSAAAARGSLLPPWDSKVTLDRLALLLRHWKPRVVVALGDSFHDGGGPRRLPAEQALRLAAMTASFRFVWVCGNHDPAPPEGIAGDCTDAHLEGPLLFRHCAGPVARGQGEISGHCHPKATVPTRAALVARPCFVVGGNRVLLPAFGAYTGGLDVRHPEIARLFPRGGRVLLLGRERLFSFAIGTWHFDAFRDSTPSVN